MQLGHEIDYLPTQAVAHTLRFLVHLIVHDSSKAKGDCCALYVRNVQCVDDLNETETLQLELVESSNGDWLEPLWPGSATPVW